MPLEYHHLSFVIFRTDCEDAMVLAARCPEMGMFSAGQNLINALKLDGEAQGYIFRSAVEPPMFVQTYMGVGILDKRYQNHAGLGVYWHLHGQPESLARLINSGVLGNRDGGGHLVSQGVAAVKGKARLEDGPAYQVLTDAWSVIDRTPGEWAICDAEGRMYGAELLRAMTDMAGFVGCGLRYSPGEEPVGRIKCRRPILLEALLLCLLTEAKTYAANAEATCVLRALGNIEGEGLALEFRYALENPQRYEAELDVIHRHLRRVGDLSGLEIQAEVIRLKRGERQLGKLPEMRIALEWIRDPAVLPTSDLKADVSFEDEDKKES